VAEWNFMEGERPREPNEKIQILDEHWHAADYLTGREDYWKRPTWPLTVENATADSFTHGILEDWTRGALHIDPSKRVFARLPDADLKKPFTTKLPNQHNHGKPFDAKDFTFEGKTLRSPEVHDSSFIIELVAKFNSQNGTILSKWDGGAGYRLQLKDGNLMFELYDATRAGSSSMPHITYANGLWHHIIIEVTMETQKYSVESTVFPIKKGRADLGPRGSFDNGMPFDTFVNNVDLIIGAEDPKESADFEIDFLRIALSTLAESRTTAAELHAWQFNGPQHRDIRGAPPKGKSRDAGAVESW
jgi:hypothetical protein